MLGLSSSGVTVMLSFTRVGLSFSTVVVTMGVSVVLLWSVGLGYVGATGFEPAASRSQSGRSTKLSYAPDVRAARKMAPRSLTAPHRRVPPRRCRCTAAHCCHGRYRDHGAARLRAALPRLRR